MSDSVSLTTNEVVQSVRRCSVNETISNPFPSLNRFGNLRLEVESFLDTLIVEFDPTIESLLVRISVESKYVE